MVFSSTPIASASAARVMPRSSIAALKRSFVIYPTRSQDVSGLLDLSKTSSTRPARLVLVSADKRIFVVVRETPDSLRAQTLGRKAKPPRAAIHPRLTSKHVHTCMEDGP